MGKEMSFKKKGLLGLGILVGLIVVALVILFFYKNHEEKIQENDIVSETEATDEVSDNTNEPTNTNTPVEGQRQDATYEEWLATGMVVAVSLQYTDFEIKEVYLASSTEVKDKNKSKGAYVLYEAEGKEKLAHSLPLDGERTKKGTMDLHTTYLGFSTFDEVSKKKVDLKKLKKMDLDMVNDLMPESMTVSLYER